MMSETIRSSRPRDCCRMKAVRKGPRGNAAIVVVVIVVVLVALPAIAVILLRERPPGNEVGAIGSLRSIIDAQQEFAKTCGNGFYAATLPTLATPTMDGQAPLLAPDLSGDRVVKRGYAISFTAGEDVRTAVSCNRTRIVSTYFVSAAPVAVGSTGIRFFATNQHGTIFQATSPIAVTFDVPRDATPLK